MGPGPRLVPGLVTEGHTIEEARKMIRDAVRAYLDRLKKSGLPFPMDDYIGLGERVEIVVDPL